jgi:hypothetical protein
MYSSELLNMTASTSPPGQNKQQLHEGLCSTTVWYFLVRFIAQAKEAEHPAATFLLEG